MDHHTLPDDPNTPGEEQMNIFDDEFEIPDFEMAPADGFRPSQFPDGPDSPIDRDPSPPIISAIPHISDHPVTPSRSPVRTSIQKSHARPDPFASPEDDDGERAAPSLSFEPDSSAGRRSISSISSHLFARTGSIRLGDGPSHPYDMYNQGTLGRSPSTATTSTIRVPTQPSSTQSGPQHPYSLYPQGVEDDMDHEDILQNPVPVGFPGLGGQSYQRRLGPDGEDQDFIGEDGHAEQLPPYTRYPEDGPEKMPLLGIPEAPTALHSRAPVAGTDPTMPLMHTTLQTQPSRPQSMTDQSVLGGSSLSSHGHSGDSQSELLSTRSWNEKTWKEKSFKEKSKTRFCGCVPLWVFFLFLGVMVFIGSVLGGVLGGWMAGVRHRKYSGPSDGFFDAKLITPTPSDLGVPTGTFSLSLSTPAAIYNSCMHTDDPNNKAWSCNLAGPPGSMITVSRGTGVDNNTLGASITYGASSDQAQAFYYGAQASWLNSTWSKFQVVLDLDSPADGPAYYFQQVFDKLVVLPGDALQAAPPVVPRNNRRDFRITLDGEWFQRKQLAKSGDKPWFCVWKNTVMQGFIYPHANAMSVASNSSASPTSVVSTTTTTASPTTTAAPTATHSAQTVQNFYTKAVFPGGTEEQYQEWYKQNMIAQPHLFMQHHYDGDGPGDDQRPPFPPMPSSLPGPPEKREDQASLPPAFPYVFKLEERRTDGNSVQPYCEQWQILENGQLGPLADPPPTVPLVEIDPPLSDYQNGVAGDTDEFEVHTCHCQWVSGRS